MRAEALTWQTASLTLSSAHLNKKTWLFKKSHLIIYEPNKLSKVLND